MSRHFISSIAFVFCALAASAAASAADDQMGFGYCVSSGIGNGNKLISNISTVFRVRDDVYNVGIVNSFNDYIAARGDDANNATTCHQYMTSYQEAEDKRNTDIISARRTGYEVHEWHWAYHGD